METTPPGLSEGDPQPLHNSDSSFLSNSQLQPMDQNISTASARKKGKLKKLASSIKKSVRRATQKIEYSLTGQKSYASLKSDPGVNERSFMDDSISINSSYSIQSSVSHMDFHYQGDFDQTYELDSSSLNESRLTDKSQTSNITLLSLTTADHSFQHEKIAQTLKPSTATTKSTRKMKTSLRSLNKRVAVNPLPNLFNKKRKITKKAEIKAKQSLLFDDHSSNSTESGDKPLANKSEVPLHGNGVLIDSMVNIKKKESGQPVDITNMPHLGRGSPSVGPAGYLDRSLVGPNKPLCMISTPVGPQAPPTISLGSAQGAIYNPGCEGLSTKPSTIKLNHRGNADQPSSAEDDSSRNPGKHESSGCQSGKSSGNYNSRKRKCSGTSKQPNKSCKVDLRCPGADGSECEKLTDVEVESDSAEREIGDVGPAGDVPEVCKQQVMITGPAGQRGDYDKMDSVLVERLNEDHISLSYADHMESISTTPAVAPWVSRGGPADSHNNIITGNLDAKQYKHSSQSSVAENEGHVQRGANFDMKTGEFLRAGTVIDGFISPPQTHYDVVDKTPVGDKSGQKTTLKKMASKSRLPYPQASKTTLLDPPPASPTQGSGLIMSTGDLAGDSMPTPDPTNNIEDPHDTVKDRREPVGNKSSVVKKRKSGLRPPQVISPTSSGESKRVTALLDVSSDQLDDEGDLQQEMLENRKVYTAETSTNSKMNSSKMTALSKTNTRTSARLRSKESVSNSPAKNNTSLINGRTRTTQHGDGSEQPKHTGGKCTSNTTTTSTTPQQHKNKPSSKNELTMVGECKTETGDLSGRKGKIVGKSKPGAKLLQEAPAAGVQAVKSVGRMKQSVSDTKKAKPRSSGTGSTNSNCSNHNTRPPKPSAAKPASAPRKSIRSLQGRGVKGSAPVAPDSLAIKRVPKNPPSRASSVAGLKEEIPSKTVSALRSNSKKPPSRASSPVASLKEEVTSKTVGGIKSKNPTSRVSSVASLKDPSKLTSGKTSKNPPSRVSGGGAVIRKPVSRAGRVEVMRNSPSRPPSGNNLNNSSSKAADGGKAKIPLVNSSSTATKPGVVKKKTLKQFKTVPPKEIPSKSGGVNAKTKSSASKTRLPLAAKSDSEKVKRLPLKKGASQKYAGEKAGGKDKKGAEKIISGTEQLKAAASELPNEDGMIDMGDGSPDVVTDNQSSSAPVIPSRARPSGLSPPGSIARRNKLQKSLAASLEPEKHDAHQIYAENVENVPAPPALPQNDSQVLGDNSMTCGPVDKKDGELSNTNTEAALLLPLQESDTQNSQTSENIPHDVQAEKQLTTQDEIIILSDDDKSESITDVPDPMPGSMDSDVMSSEHVDAPLANFILPKIPSCGESRDKPVGSATVQNEEMAVTNYDLATNIVLAAESVDGQAENSNTGVHVRNATDGKDAESVSVNYDNVCMDVTQQSCDVPVQSYADAGGCCDGDIGITSEVAPLASAHDTPLDTTATADAAQTADQSSDGERLAVDETGNVVILELLDDGLESQEMCSAAHDYLPGVDITSMNDASNGEKTTLSTDTPKQNLDGFPLSESSTDLDVLDEGSKGTVMLLEETSIPSNECKTTDNLVAMATETVNFDDQSSGAKNEGVVSEKVEIDKNLHPSTPDVSQHVEKSGENIAKNSGAELHGGVSEMPSELEEIRTPWSHFPVDHNIVPEMQRGKSATQSGGSEECSSLKDDSDEEDEVSSCQATDQGDQYNETKVAKVTVSQSSENKIGANAEQESSSNITPGQSESSLMDPASKSEEIIPISPPALDNQSKDAETMATDISESGHFENDDHYLDSERKSKPLIPVVENLSKDAETMATGTYVSGHSDHYLDIVSKLQTPVEENPSMQIPTEKREGQSSLGGVLNQTPLREQDTLSISEKNVAKKACLSNGIEYTHKDCVNKGGPEENEHCNGKVILCVPVTVNKDEVGSATGSLSMGPEELSGEGKGKGDKPDPCVHKVSSEHKASEEVAGSGMRPVLTAVQQDMETDSVSKQVEDVLEEINTDTFQADSVKFDALGGNGSAGILCAEIDQVKKSDLCIGGPNTMIGTCPSFQLHPSLKCDEVIVDESLECSPRAGDLMASGKLEDKNESCGMGTSTVPEYIVKSSKEKCESHKTPERIHNSGDHATVDTEMDISVVDCSSKMPGNCSPVDSGIVKDAPTFQRLTPRPIAIIRSPLPSGFSPNPQVTTTRSVSSPSMSSPVEVGKLTRQSMLGAMKRTDGSTSLKSHLGEIPAFFQPRDVTTADAQHRRRDLRRHTITVQTIQCETYQGARRTMKSESTVIEKKVIPEQSESLTGSQFSSLPPGGDSSKQCDKVKTVKFASDVRELLPTPLTNKCVTPPPGEQTPKYILPVPRKYPPSSPAENQRIHNLSAMERLFGSKGSPRKTINPTKFSTTSGSRLAEWRGQRSASVSEGSHNMRQQLMSLISEDCEQQGDSSEKVGDLNI